MGNMHSYSFHFVYRVKDKHWIQHMWTPNNVLFSEEQAEDWWWIKQNWQTGDKNTVSLLWTDFCWHENDRELNSESIFMNDEYIPTACCKNDSQIFYSWGVKSTKNKLRLKHPGNNRLHESSNTHHDFVLVQENVSNFLSENYQQQIVFLLWKFGI